MEEFELDKVLTIVKEIEKLIIGSLETEDDRVIDTCVKEACELRKKLERMGFFVITERYYNMQTNAYRVIVELMRPKKDLNADDARFLAEEFIKRYGAGHTKKICEFWNIKVPQGFFTQH